jgi:hypothetical protein
MSDAQGTGRTPEKEGFFFGIPGLRPGGRRRALALCAVLLSLLVAQVCASPRDQFFTTREANERIWLAFLLKDNECGTSHVITVPILAPARMAEVNACVIGVLDAECTDWEENDPTPDECRSLQVNLLQ